MQPLKMPNAPLATQLKINRLHKSSLSTASLLNLPKFQYSLSIHSYWQPAGTFLSPALEPTTPLRVCPLKHFSPQNHVPCCRHHTSGESSWAPRRGVLYAPGWLSGSSGGRRSSRLGGPQYSASSLCPTPWSEANAPMASSGRGW